MRLNFGKRCPECAAVGAQWAAEGQSLRRCSLCFCPFTMTNLGLVTDKLEIPDGTSGAEICEIIQRLRDENE